MQELAARRLTCDESCYSEQETRQMDRYHAADKLTNKDPPSSTDEILTDH